MDVDISIRDLKQKLLAEVRLLFRSNGTAWKSPILEVLQELKQPNISAALFGGTLRSLLVSRLFKKRFGRPRDVDVVVSGAALSDLEKRFSGIIIRRTRFGGLQLKSRDWRFDVWPLSETWAFRKDHANFVTFADLPSTTTFNLEAIAVEAWGHEGRPRSLFSGDDQFFKGILARTLELNRTDNPFPELTVIRAIVMASELHFKIGPNLAGYIREVSPSLTEATIDNIQKSHYGQCRLSSGMLKALADLIHRTPAEESSVSLPHTGQLHFWESENEYSPRINIHHLD